MDFGNVKRHTCVNVPIGFLPIQSSEGQKQQDMEPDRNDKGFWYVFSNVDFHFLFRVLIAVILEFFCEVHRDKVIIASSIRLLQAARG